MKKKSEESKKKLVKLFVGFNNEFIYRFVGRLMEFKSDEFKQSSLLFVDIRRFFDYIKIPEAEKQIFFSVLNMCG